MEVDWGGRSRVTDSFSPSTLDALFRQYGLRNPIWIGFGPYSKPGDALKSFVLDIQEKSRAVCDLKPKYGLPGSAERRWRLTKSAKRGRGKILDHSVMIKTI